MTRAVIAATLGVALITFPLESRRASAGESGGAGDLLSRAQAAADDVDFATARKLVDQALSAGGMDVGELARAHRFAGEISAALGDKERARDHFVRWILLDPRATLAPGVSPKISAAFDDARQEAARLGALSLTARIERTPGRAVVIVDGKDPVEMVAQIRVRGPDGGDRVEHGQRAELEVADTRPVSVTVTALDGDGNQLWSEQVKAAARLREVRHGFPGWARWPTWAVASGVGLAAGGFFVWRVEKDHDELAELNRNSSMHTYDEAKELEDRGRRDALIANISFGVAGAAAIAAVLTYVLEPSGVDLVPVASPEGAGITARVRF